MNFTGFGTFGKGPNPTAKANKTVFAATPIDSDPEDTNEEDTKEMSAIMGISSFGRKAQNFDIIVSFEKNYMFKKILVMLSFLICFNSIIYKL